MRSMNEKDCFLLLRTAVLNHVRGDVPASGLHVSILRTGNISPLLPPPTRAAPLRTVVPTPHHM